MRGRGVRGARPPSPPITESCPAAQSRRNRSLTLWSATYYFGNTSVSDKSRQVSPHGCAGISRKIHVVTKFPMQPILHRNIRMLNRRGGPLRNHPKGFPQCNMVISSDRGRGLLDFSITTSTEAVTWTLPCGSMCWRCSRRSPSSAPYCWVRSKVTAGCVLSSSF